VVVVGGEFLGGSPTNVAIENEAHLYLRNVSAAGYQSLLRERGSLRPGLSETEYVVPRQLGVWKSADGSLKLPIESAPTAPTTPVGAWVSVVSFGANGSDTLDDAAAIRAAFASGAATVYFPAGRYFADSTITVGTELRSVYFFESVLAAGAGLPMSDPLIEVGSGSPLELFQGSLDTGSRSAILHSGSRPLILRSGDYTPYVGTGDGRLFVEDVVGGPWQLGASQHSWMRQINDETNGTKITNRGTLWILGYKTEKQGSVLDNLGGRIELLGGLIYPVAILPLEQPMVRNRGGAMSLILGESAFVSGSDHKILVEDQRSGVTRRFFDREAPGRVGNGLGAHLTLYRSSNDAGLPADAPPLALYCFSENTNDCLGGNNANGTGISFVSDGINASAVRLDGNASVQLPSDLIGSNGGTVSLWMRTTTDTNDWQILHYLASTADPNADGGGPDNELHLHLTAEERGALFIEAGGSDILLQTPEPIANGQWRHLAATWRNNGFVDLYLDGRRVAFSGPASWNSFSGSTLRLGRPTAATRRYVGDLDEVRLYDRALRHDEILDLYFSEFPFTNYPPAVDAGPDRVLQRSDFTLAIAGQSNDDGQPTGAASIQWTQRNGPAGTFFGSPTQAATSATFPSPGAYTLRLSIDDGALGAFDEVGVEVFAPLSAPWTNLDIGAPELDGWTTDNVSRRFVVNASGAAIAGNAQTGGDAFHFVHRDIDGSAQELLGCVDVFDASDADARAGLMFRGDTSFLAANGMIALRGGGGLVYQNRAGANGNTTTTLVDPAIVAPICLRLERVATNQVRGRYSLDRGASWISLTPVTVNVGGGSKSIGLATNSGSSLRTTAVFSNVCFAAAGSPGACATALEDFVRDGFE
jgi:hypothetical protein